MRIDPDQARIRMGSKGPSHRSQRQTVIAAEGERKRALLAVICDERRELFVDARHESRSLELANGIVLLDIGNVESIVTEEVDFPAQVLDVV